jgi:carbonic anhydrase
MMMITTQAETMNAEIQKATTPEAALARLRAGNARFVAGTPIERDLHEQIKETAGGQYPFAILLGCVDSRVPVETVFDQGIGDVFAARVAGNVVNGDLLGSMEFACKLAGSKAVIVLGHTSCGAVKGSIAGARLGNLTGLVKKIEPAIDATEADPEADDYADKVAETNVRLTLSAIRDQSDTLAEMERDGEIVIVGAMYDVATGAVHFLD